MIKISSAIHKPFDKAELFNQYFNSVFSTSDFVLPPIHELLTPQSQLSNIQIDSSDVFNARHSLDPSKAHRLRQHQPLHFEALFLLFNFTNHSTFLPYFVLSNYPYAMEDSQGLPYFQKR